MASWSRSGGSPGRPGMNPFDNTDASGEHQRPQDTRLEQTQREVDEVVTIMKSNVEKVMERDSKLSELDLRAEALNSSAAMFQTTSKSVKRRMWWRNLKWTIILGLVVIAFIIVISVWIANEVHSSGNSGDSSNEGNAVTEAAAKADHKVAIFRLPAGMSNSK